MGDGIPGRIPKNFPDRTQKKIPQKTGQGVPVTKTGDGSHTVADPAMNPDGVLLIHDPGIVLPCRMQVRLETDTRL